MVVFAISVFGTTLPHIFYGESLLMNKNAMQGRGSGTMSIIDNNATSSSNDTFVNVCRSHALSTDSFLNRTLKGRWPYCKRF